MNRSFRPAIALSACLAFFGAPSALAQDAAADAAPPPVDCPKPDGTALTKAPKAEMTKYQQRIDAYKACVNAYAATNMAKAKDLQAQAQGLQTQAQTVQAQAVSTQARAQAYATASNAAIDDFNAFVNELNKQTQDGKK